MSDIWRELPLSGRERSDESGVHRGWDAEVAAVRTNADALLARTSDPDAGAAFAAALSSRRPLAARLRGRDRPATLAELDRIVYAYIALSTRLGAEPQIPPRASGAVALGRAAAAPTPIRAVIAGHSLHATDAGWTFGRGPVLEATAVELLTFLSGEGSAAPAPPAS